MSVYLDCNATTPIDPGVEKEFLLYVREEFGNAGSRTHEYGNRAKQAVQKARDQVGKPVRAKRDEVIFTSGATESNNLSILGLQDFGLENERRHIISSAIEHKAVLEPLERLETLGFEVTLLKPDASGIIEASQVADALRPETLLVSIMHVNNETGAIQPLKDIAEALAEHDAYFHTDAAQGYGKLNADLQNTRLDLISLSGHKLYAPKGVGALIVRRRGFERVPLKPLTFGGGQERGLRPGTLPVAMIVALGKAAELAEKEAVKRSQRCLELKKAAIAAFDAVGGQINGDPERTINSTLNVSIPDLDSEAVMLALKNEVAISNGSACTSHEYTESHVLAAMGLPADRISGALRISWCHLTEDPPWERVRESIKGMR